MYLGPSQTAWGIQSLIIGLYFAEITVILLLFVIVVILFLKNYFPALLTY